MERKIMKTFKDPYATLSVSFDKGEVASLILGGREILQAKTPLFRLRLMDEKGESIVYTAYDAKAITEEADGARFAGFPEDISVRVSTEKSETALVNWCITVENRTGKLVEWVEFPNIVLKPLLKNGGDGKVLFPYNEGALVDDLDLREASPFPYREAEYPSLGAYSMFPNMLSSQFLCYLAGEYGFYCGAHDKKRGVKAIDFTKETGGVAFRFRTFCGRNFGEDYIMEYDTVWASFEGAWQDGAAIYRDWFEANLPEGLQKVSETPLPKWYEKLPLVISYPVRGLHDADMMEPNALFPYKNALPLVDEIAEKTKSQLLVLLMHWEGTAPWAPPYVWPPYGGERMFHDFADAIHERGHLLGVYCSGFGYTIKSNLVDDYDNLREYSEKGYAAAMCRGKDGEEIRSTICTTQRDGRDICVGSSLGREILNEAYQPLFESKVDYAQILDQNHGGGQYFCYGRDHGHAPCPGEWMTDEMKKLLASWKEKAAGKLLGCESAASEPFTPYLRFSDNRYELNWHLGEPVPLYAFLYHEYLHNFMGNQVSCGLDYKEDTMTCRMAYSFAAGDAMTIVLTPFGELMSNWGCHDFGYAPNKDNVLTFAMNMQKLQETDAKAFLIHGRMEKPEDYSSEKVMFHSTKGREILFPAVFTSKWSLNGETRQFFINHTAKEQTITFRGAKITIPALAGIAVE